MPSPVGHALGGIAIGWCAVRRPEWRAAAVLAAVAVAPDLDLLVGDHRGISHSIGAAILAGAAAGILTRRASWALAVALAWSSHVALDWLSNDTRAPVGVMALWPFTADYYKAPLEIFPPVSRRYRVAAFWLHNLKALVVELLVLGPLTLLAVRARRRR